MRCRKCGEKAVINMRQHKLALCSSHFLDWVPEQVERAIKRYHMFTRHEHLLLAVSGGKDSLSLWDILNRLGYIVDGLYIGLGIDGGVNYSEASLAYASSFAQEHNLQLHIKDIKTEYGETIPDLATRTHRGHDKPCSVCGLTKRHVMNQLARQQHYDALITGHNLDVVEPYLLQLGFLERTSHGRVATALAYEHLGIAIPEDGQQKLF